MEIDPTATDANGNSGGLLGNMMGGGGSSGAMEGMTEEMQE